MRVSLEHRGLFALRAPLPKATALVLGFVMPVARPRGLVRR